MTEFTEANRKYFDQMATAYKDRFANVMKILSEETSKRRLWISDHWTDSDVGMGKGKEIKMLEYACGPGTLAPYLTKVIGFDVSENMVTEYNRNAETLGFSDRMTAYNVDLLAERVPEEYSGPDFHNLDVVAISMALHHFEHPDLALRRLAPRLRKGGVCYIIDFVPHSGHGHGHGHTHNQGPGNGPGQEHGDSHGHGHGNEFADAAHTVKTHGFSKADMQKLFEGAGLTVRFDYQELPEPLVFNKDDQTYSKTAFVARVQRA